MPKISRLTAEFVLNQHWDGSLPINVDDIAGKLGLTVEYSNDINQRLNDDGLISGALVYENNAYHCIINKQQHTNRQRFTLAHEIGHFALNHGEKYDNTTTLYRKDGGIANQNQNDEMQANVFASELLMPESQIYQQVIKNGIEDIGELAKIFQVSEQAMWYRLKSTGWI